MSDKKGGESRKSMSVYYMHFTQLAACFLHFCLSLPTPHHSPLPPLLPTYTSVQLLPALFPTLY